MIEVKGKTCNKCGTFRMLEDGFYKAKGVADGYANRCKGCAKGSNRKRATTIGFMRNAMDKLR